MKIYSTYDNESLIEKTWYDSSTVLYSECKDIPNANKELKIIFNNGRCYIYKDVDVFDYLKFRESSSQGKSIGQYITKKKDGKNVYECTRLDDVDIDKIKKEKEILSEKPKIIYYTDTKMLYVIGNGKKYAANQIDSDSIARLTRILDILDVKTPIEYRKTTEE